TSSMPWKRAPNCATGPLRRQRSGLEFRTRQPILAYWLRLVKRHAETEVPVSYAALQFYESCENGYAGAVIELVNLRPTGRWRYWVLLLLLASAAAQVTPSPAPTAPAVPYTSVSQLNLMLSQLEQIAQTMQVDLAKLRIDKWKTDSNTKRGSEADVESLQRN